MMDIETYRASEYLPQKAAIAGLPEQIGLNSEDVLNAFLATATYKEAALFVKSYLDHMKKNIDPGFINDATELTKRHLIDGLYFAHAPAEMKPNHPANLKATAKRERARKLIIEAMIDEFDEGEYDVMDETVSSNREYVRLRNEILKERASLPA